MYNCYSYTANNPLKYTDPSGYKLGISAMAEGPSSDNDRGRYYGIGGGGGINWPRFGTLDVPNKFEADVALTEQFYLQGDMFAYSYLNDRIESGDYPRSDIENSRHVYNMNYRWEDKTEIIPGDEQPMVISDDGSFTIRLLEVCMVRTKVWYFETPLTGDNSLGSYGSVFNIDNVKHWTDKEYFYYLKQYAKDDWVTQKIIWSETGRIVSRITLYYVPNIIFQLGTIPRNPGIDYTVEKILNDSTLTPAEKEKLLILLEGQRMRYHNR